MVTIRGVTSLRYLQNIESKFRLYVRQGVLFIRNQVAVLLFQLGIQEGNRAIRGHEVAVVVRGVVRERPERKSVAVKVLGIAQQSQDKVPAPHIVRQVAEEITSVRVIAHVLDNGAAICIAMGFLDFFPRSVGEPLQE